MKNLFIYSEKETSGIYFRSPFYREYFDWYNRGFGEENEGFDQLYMVERIGKGVKETFIGILLLIMNGGLSWYRSKKNWLETCDNAAGFKYRWIRSPIYFVRMERKAKYIVNDPDSPIKEIRAKGFHYVDERCGGACVKENGMVYLRNGLKIKLEGRKDIYHWTYENTLSKAVERCVFSTPKD